MLTASRDNLRIRSRALLPPYVGNSVARRRALLPSRREGLARARRASEPTLPARGANILSRSEGIVGGGTRVLPTNKYNSMAGS